MIDRAGEHVGDGFNAAMRMPREACEKILGTFVAEIVEQQERIEVLGVAEAEGTLQLYAGAFEGVFGFENALDRSD